MVVDVKHRHIWNILDNVSLVLPSDIDIFHENNSSNFTLFVDLSDFELHQAKVINVESMVVDENLQCVDDFVDDNKVQYNDTLEDYMNDEEDVEYEFDDETSERNRKFVYL